MIFPSDANILFLNGALHEIFASPSSQAVVLAMPPETHTSVNSEYAELRKAQGYFQQAAKSNPELAEVSLHLGRVSGLLGNHTAAAVELRRAAALLTEPHLQYYAALFLGREEDMIGHQDAAREQFYRAATLYPGAQSPLLALGELMSRNGDYAGALAAMQRVMTLSMYDSRLMDPWWRYHATHVPDAETLMAEMRKTFGGLPR